MAPGTGIQRPRLGSRKPRKMASSHTGAHSPTIRKYIAFVACAAVMLTGQINRIYQQPDVWQTMICPNQSLQGWQDGILFLFLFLLLLLFVSLVLQATAHCRIRLVSMPLCIDR